MGGGGGVGDGRGGEGSRKEEGEAVPDSGSLWEKENTMSFAEAWYLCSMHQ